MKRRGDRLTLPSRDVILEAVRRLLGSPGLQKLRSITREEVRSTSDGVSRVEGEARRDASSWVPWSLVSKELAHTPQRASPDSLHYWRRELDLYRSELFQHLPPLVRVPRLVAVTEESATFARLWLAPVRTTVRSELSVEQMRAAAHCLGQLSRRLSEASIARRVPALARDGLAQWIAEGLQTSGVARKPFEVALDEARRALGSSRLITAEVVSVLLRLKERRERLLSLLRNLPQAIGHMDPHCANMGFPPGGQRGIVLFDWSQCGPGAVGEDLSVLHGVTLFRTPLAADPGRLFEDLLAAFCTGARRSSRSARVEVRTAFSVASALRFLRRVRFACEFMVGAPPGATTSWGKTPDHVQQRLAHQLPHMMELCREALRISGAPPARNGGNGRAPRRRPPAGETSLLAGSRPDDHGIGHVAALPLTSVRDLSGPTELARAITERYLVDAASGAEGKLGHLSLSRRGLGTLLLLLWQASMKPEEGRYPNLTVYVPPARFQIPGQDHQVPLARSVPLSQSTLRRIAPMVPPRPHALIIGERRGRLHVRGIGRVETVATSRSTLSTLERVLYPGLFLTIDGPGALSVYAHPNACWSLRGNVVSRPSDLGTDHAMRQVCEAAARNQCNDKKNKMVDLALMRKQIEFVMSSLLCVCREMRHGALLLVAGASLIGKHPPRPIKSARVRIERLSLGELAAKFLREPEHRGNWHRVMRDVLNVVAHLATIDGAVLLDAHLRVSAAGAIVGGRRDHGTCMVDPETGRPRRAMGASGNPSFRMEDHGTRHRAAAAFACARPHRAERTGNLAFVVSQDGDIHSFRGASSTVANVSGPFWPYLGGPGSGS